MKKNLLITIGLLFLLSFSLEASNRYWVGGTGLWNDPAHWSAISGGAGGAGVPAINDNVYFDENSTDNTLSVTISGTALCSDLMVSPDLGTVVFYGNSVSVLQISGSVSFSDYVKNNFTGEVLFSGTGTKNIDFKTAVPKGNIRFNGGGTWNLTNNLILSFNSRITIDAGQVNAVGRDLQAFGIQWAGAAPKSLNISNSRLVLAQPLDETGTGNSSVIKTGTHLYPRSSGGSRTIDSIQVVVVAPLCNNSADGSATVTVFSPDGGPFTFDWTGSPSCFPAPCSGNPLNGVGNGSYLLTVTDLSDFEQFQQFVQVIAPNPIGVNFVKKRPKCNGQCNGNMTANIVNGSGTPPYSYAWSWTAGGGGSSTQQTITNLCAGTYTLVITDGHNCAATFTTTLTQPAVVAPNATSTNLTCFGVCNGTANSAPTGGNTPTAYTYAWTGPAPFSSTSQNLTGLCAGTYIVTVRDDSSCVGTSSVVITQPPVLAITPSHTNITCFGAQNGAASVAPVTGGTGGYTFVWSGSTPGPYTGQTTASISNLGPGTYTVVVTDANGCTATSNFTITQPAVIIATASGTNVPCFSQCNGTATVAVSGGAGGNTYNWNGTPTGDGTPNISNLCAGSYTVTVTDMNGCSDTGAVTITEPPLLVPNPTSTNVICFGACNGTATAAPTGGTGVYTYTWTSTVPPPYTGQGTANLTNLCPGTYSVTITDAKGCDTMQSVTVTQPPILTLNIVKTNVNCNNACDATATATAGGGTPGYTYVWTGPAGATLTGQGTSALTGLCPGAYSLTVTDVNGCSITKNFTITQPNVLNVTLNSTVLLCNGDCNATITSTVSGGTPPYTFLWSTGQTTSSITNRCAGNYTLTVKDANNCTKVVPITVSQPTALNVVTSSTNVTCFGLCTGTASVIAGGGTPGYTYLWAPGGQTTSSISSLCAGSYTVTVKDANQCTMTSVVTITAPPPLFGNPSVANDVTCFGLCNGSATSAVTGGTSPYTIDWAGAATPVGDGTSTITNLCTGTYSMFTTDANGCTSNQSVTITQPPLLVAPISGSTSSCNICNGTATVAPAGGTPPYTYLWSDPGGQTTPVATGLCPNVTYTVTITDFNGCTATGSVTISQTIKITITTSNTTLSCFGACDGIATANPSGGQNPYSYLWVNSSGTVGNTQTVSTLCAGTYTVTVVDANGCLNSDTVTFTNPPILDVTATHTNASCGGTCDGTATGTPTGGTGAYSYSWSTSPVQTTATAAGLCAGTYTLTVTDASGCTDTVSVIITEPPLVVDNPTFSDANCLQSDGTITVAPTGGTGTYTYFWAGSSPVTGQGTPSATGLLPGTYTLTITDTPGCTYTFNYLVSNINGPDLVMAHTNAVCNNACDGTATVTASGGAGGFSYNWAPGVPAGSGTSAITSLCGTVTYSVTVTDAAGCISLDTATIINPTPINPHKVVANESCGGTCNGAITLNPTGGGGGYTYTWSGPSGPLPSTSNQVGLCAGLYTVTIKDANNCDTTLNITITSPPILTVTVASTNVKCTGACDGAATATVAGGSGAGYTYSWTNQPASIVLASIVNLCPNQYVVTVTDGNGCTAKDTADITEPPLLTTITSQTNASCNGLCDGAAFVTTAGGTPGYNFSWSPAVFALPNNDTVSALCAGSYTVTVTDANNCVSSPLPIVITQPPPILPTVTFTNAKCNGSCDGTATSVPSGGTAPYTYNWSGAPSGNGTPSVTGLCGGAHTITVTDSLGCSNSQNFTLVDPPTLIANPSSTSPTCTNLCDGAATATPVGGTAGYTFSWSTLGSPTTQSISNLCPGIYNVIVTDNNNCKDTQSVTVINPPLIDIASSSTPAACGACDGTITVNPITGTPGYTYLWSPAPTAGQGTANATSVCAGIYNVTVTDTNGCNATFTIPMNNAGGATGETVSTIDAKCNNVCDGSGSVVPIGGVPPYTYLWNNTPPTANDTAINLCAGSYFVQVTDSNSCIHFSPVTINEPTPIVSGAVITQAICSTVCNGAISLFPSGGTPGPGPGYTYLWAGPGPLTGQGTSSITGLCPGTYSVTIRDNNNCVKVDSFVVSQSTPLTAVVTSANVSCANTCSGMAYLTISSGTPLYAIQWSDPLGQTNDTATALCAGAYTVMITDANGCKDTLNTTITATPAVAINATVTNANCGVCDGSAVAAPTGGTPPYSLLWSINAQTGTSVTNLCAGLYTVDVTDAAGCVSNFGIPVSNTNGPTSLAITSSNISCNGGTGAVTGVTPTGGNAPYSYLWIQSGQTTPAINNLSAGTYFIQVTDVDGCSIVDSVAITEPSPILANQVITAATCGVCDGSITIAPSGGTAPYTVLWNNGSTALSLTNLCAGVYSVQITDAAGCTVNVVITLNNFNGPSLSITSTDAICNAQCNGTATVIASGGVAPYSYAWNDVLNQNTLMADSLCHGNYAVTVTGNDGCISIGTVTISEPSAIGFSFVNATDPLCNGDATGSITVIPSGGTLPYSFGWSPSGGTAATASNLVANTYSITVTDANGCSAMQTTVLTQNPALTISSAVINPSCNNLPDGSIDVTVGGGTGAGTYAYTWSGASSATTEDISGIALGSYFITVTDGNNCTISDTSVLSPVQTVTVSAGNDTTFCQNGSITLTATGNNGITYQWFETPSNTSVGNTASIVITPPTGTTSYYVISDNGTGCSANDTITLTSNILPTANAGSDVTIVVGTSAVIGGSPTGSAGTTLQWKPIPNLDNATISNPTATPSVTTTYTVTATTPQGCSASDSVIVKVLPAIIIPDGISPNADGDNDEWMIDGIELFPDCVVEVYNRWGELLFQSVGYKEHWKGTYQGKELPVGTYYYIIDLKDPLFPDVYTGPITILR